MQYYRGYSTVFTMESVFSIPDNRNIWWAMGLEMTDRLLEIIRYSYTAQQTVHCNQCRELLLLHRPLLMIVHLVQIAKHNLYHLLLKLKVCTMYNTFYFKVRTFYKSNKVRLKIFCALKINFHVHVTSVTYIYCIGKVPFIKAI